MLSFRQAFLLGSRDVARHWTMLLPLYMCVLLSGLIQSWPVLAAGASGALYNPLLNDVARGDADMLANLFIGDPVTVGTAALWILLVLPLAALFSLAYNFFSGGTLSVYAQRRSFWAGCRRTFWAFTGLGVLLVALAALALLATIVLIAAPGITAVGALLAGLALLQLIGVLGEYARAIAVARDRRNPLVLLSMASVFCLRNFGGVLALALLGLLLHGLLAALYVLLARSSAGSPWLLLWQQLGMLGWLAVKLLRLAWAQRYIQADDRARLAAGPARPLEAAGPTYD